MRSKAILAAVLVVAAAACATSPAVRDEKLVLEIADGRTEREAGQPLVLRARFVNVGTSPAYVIEPQQGSFHGWLSPTYDVGILAPGGRYLDLPGPCGELRAVFDKKTMHSVPPGGAKTLSIRTPFAPDVPGTYHVRLRYFVEERAYPGPTYRAPSPERVTSPTEPAMDEAEWREWPRGVFVGRLLSNAIEISIE